MKLRIDCDRYKSFHVVPVALSHTIFFFQITVAKLVACIAIDYVIKYLARMSKSKYLTELTALSSLAICGHFDPLSANTFVSNRLVVLKFSRRLVQSYGLLKLF